MLLRKTLSIALVMFFILGAALSTPQPAQAAPPMQSTVTITYNGPADKTIADADGGITLVPPQPIVPVTTQDILHVADMGTIVDVDVTVDITHDYVFDLTLSLSHGGTSVELVNQVDGECDDLDITFNDGAAALPSTCTTPPNYDTGTFAPSGSLANFNGMDVNGQWTLSITDNFPEPFGGDNGGYLNSWSITVTFDVTAIVNTEDGPFFLADGRENKYDIWATAAVYCEPYGVDVYAIDADGQGTLAFSATTAEINALGIPAEGSTPDQMLIDEGMGFRLYRLPDGQMQLNGPANGDPNGYVFIWSACGF